MSRRIKLSNKPRQQAKSKESTTHKESTTPKESTTLKESQSVPEISTNDIIQETIVKENIVKENIGKSAVDDYTMFMSMIWADINFEAEAIVFSDIPYRPGSLSNEVYDIIDDRDKRHQLIKQNKVNGSELSMIRVHRDCIMDDTGVDAMVCALFRKEEIATITPLDRVFLNSYYRCLLRAKLEYDHIGKELLSGLIITGYANTETDAALVQTMVVLRIVCKFLGITSTIHAESFSFDKLYQPEFWSSVSNQFIKLFGENRIPLIENDFDSNVHNDASAVMRELRECQERCFHQKKVLLMLNMVYHSWSGSVLIADADNMVSVIPATYISRMMSKLR